MMVVIPNEQQIKNCTSMGWQYIGDGLFEHLNGWIGYFTIGGFVKED